MSCPCECAAAGLPDHGSGQTSEREIEEARGAKQQQLKQIRLRAKTGEHDIDFKVRRARSFLQRNDKVKINVLFRGRENAHTIGRREMHASIIEALSDLASTRRAWKAGGRWQS